MTFLAEAPLASVLRAALRVIVLAALLPGCCFMPGMSEEDAERFHPELGEVTQVALAYSRVHPPLLEVVGELQRLVRSDALGMVGFRAGRDANWVPLWHVMFFAEGVRGSLHGIVFVRRREDAYVAVGIELSLDGGTATFGETPSLPNPDSDGHGGGSGGGD